LEEVVAAPVKKAEIWGKPSEDRIKRKFFAKIVPTVKIAAVYKLSHNKVVEFLSIVNIHLLKLFSTQFISVTLCLGEIVLHNITRLLKG
jgi:hypothetical protein